jgi:hypothetical protein
MEDKNFEEALELAVSLLIEEMPQRAAPKGVYSKLVRTAFKKIKKMNSNGFSFVSICRVFRKTGLLPEDSNPSSLRRAFRDEEKRRAKAVEILKALREEDDTGSNEKGMRSVISTFRSCASDDREQGEEERRERIKNMTSCVVDTGTGTIRKNADGSFDF